MMMRAPAVGPNRLARLRAINSFMRTWYGENPGTNRLPRLKMGNLTIRDWYELHGPNVKAGNSRAAAPLFAALTRRFLPEGSPEHVAARALTSYLEEFYRIIYTQPMFMERTAIDRIRVVCEEMGFYYQSLREYCARTELLAFNVTPKTHKIQHVPMLCEVINPRCVQCYAEESLIGTVAKVYKASMSGRYEGGLQRNVLAKHVLGLCVRFEP